MNYIATNLIQAISFDANAKYKTNFICLNQYVCQDVSSVRGTQI